MGVLTAFVFEHIMPLFTKSDTDSQALFLLTFTEKKESLLYLFTFVFAFVSGGLILSRYFVKPLLFILSFVRQLSKGNYDSGILSKVIYKRGKLKKRYFLYKEVLEDLSHLAEVLESVKEERKQLELSKKNWINGISHDLKTPLSYIIGYSSLLKAEDYRWDKEESDNFLDEIYNKGKYLEQLADDMNLVYNLEGQQAELPLRLEDFDLIPFLQRLVAEVMNDPAGARYHFAFLPAVESLRIYADSKLLQRAIQNLLMNSIHHNAEDTSIEIKVFISEDTYTVIEISDNGAGLTPETIERFNGAEGFLNNSSVYKRKGLGLSIVKNIVKAHHGHIIAEKNSITGTTFRILIPIALKN
jgi:signal transduction histidine kinase